MKNAEEEGRVQIPGTEITIRRPVPCRDPEEMAKRIFNIGSGLELPENNTGHQELSGVMPEGQMNLD